jgi:hypothetical protein
MMLVLKLNYLRFLESSKITIPSQGGYFRVGFCWSYPRTGCNGRENVDQKMIIFGVLKIVKNYF